MCTCGIYSTESHQVQFLTRCSSPSLGQDQSWLGAGRGRARAGEEAPEAPQPWPERSAGGPPWACPATLWQASQGVDISPHWHLEGKFREGRGPGLDPMNSLTLPTPPTCARVPLGPWGGAGDVTRGTRAPAAVATAPPLAQSSRQWPGGVPGDAEGPRSATTAPPPLVRTAESGGEQTPAPLTHVPRGERDREGKREGQREGARERGAPDPAAAALSPVALLLGPGSGRTTPQEKVPDSGRVSLASGDPASLHPPQQDCGSLPGLGAVSGGGCGPCGPSVVGVEPGLQRCRQGRRGSWGWEGRRALTSLSPCSYSQAGETWAVLSGS